MLKGKIPKQIRRSKMGKKPSRVRSDEATRYLDAKLLCTKKIEDQKKKK